jgi:tetratricopeptide (TPR) repeat protein
MSGDQGRAIADHDRAIALNPDFAVTYNNRGVARNLRSEYDRAIIDFDKALALDPGLAEAYLNRGIASVGKDPENPAAWRRALEDFDRTLDLDPLNASAYYWRGLARSEEYDRAIADLDLAMTLDPGLASAAYRAKAELADHAGRPKDAEAALRKFLDVTPPTAPGVDTARTRLRELGRPR